MKTNTGDQNRNTQGVKCLKLEEGKVAKDIIAQLTENIDSEIYTDNENLHPK